MVSLQAVTLMLLEGDEVIIEDDLNHYFKVSLEKVPAGVDFSGETTLIIHSDKLRGV